MATTKKKDFIHAVGRRKSAVARVRLYSGKGPTVVNQVPIGDYFPGGLAKVFYEIPFRVTDSLGKYYASVKVEGGGKQAQLGAFIHGIARALDKADPQKYHPSLKKEGLLTRDARTRERRKPGLAQKARAAKQSPKR